MFLVRLLFDVIAKFIFEISGAACPQRVTESNVSYLRQNELNKIKYGIKAP